MVVNRLPPDLQGIRIGLNGLLAGDLTGQRWMATFPKPNRELGSHKLPRVNLALNQPVGLFKPQAIPFTTGNR